MGQGTRLLVLQAVSRSPTSHTAGNNGRECVGSDTHVYTYVRINAYASVHLIHIHSLSKSCLIEHIKALQLPSKGLMPPFQLPLGKQAASVLLQCCSLDLHSPRHDLHKTIAAMRARVAASHNIQQSAHRFLATPTVFPRRPVVFVCWPFTRRPQ
jgi:hypothetical protein